ncbi:energy-coupling factor transporter transmembrane component T family protein [Agromyces seonyuensis]|uniref:Energy-coupling factor transporter transmembrane protein EcfT n=1 Tax=Agromyces seonyuensis TaxID=2662446 RepID=A0A6I4NSR1_9MICO|nr:energy-coupling factor transporter transmembrane component T [Agromyces seonyuensis]MWB97161.1 energy-coupling factor transporter transmembrane protein EcfT [Agromyces seonyuensis]
MSAVLDRSDARGDTRTVASANRPARRKPRASRDGLSVEWVKLELMRVAYATRGGFLAVRDPRAVLAWYLIASIAPWFTYSTTTLALLFVGAALAAVFARIGPLLLALFVIGMAGQGVWVLAMAWVFSGEADSIAGIVDFSLKVGAVSLVTMAAFVSLDPEKASDALLALRAPVFVGFAVNYGYRMLPVLVDEYHAIVDGHRVRSAPLRSRGFLGHRWLLRTARIAVHSFYPLMLNTALRTRTTVEMLETKGFGHATASEAVRKVRLAHLRFGAADVLLLVATVLAIALAFVLGSAFPVLG